VVAERGAAAAGFDADEAHISVGDEFVEHADGVGAAADAGDNRRGQTVFLLENLRARFAADHAVEVAHHDRVRMRAKDAAKAVVRGADVGDPVAHRLVDGVFQRARAGGDAADFGAEEAHAVNVELLAAHVLFAHINDALEAEESADGGGGDAVLAGSGLRDDAMLAHAHGEQSLAEAVVDFVRAGVEQVFALEIDFCAAEGFAETRGEVERRGAAGEVAQERIELQMEVRIGLGFLIRVVELIERRDEGFGNVASAVWAEASGDGLGDGSHENRVQGTGCRVQGTGAEHRLQVAGTHSSQRSA